MTGSDGPPGPIADPPALAMLSPRWGSANTHVTITGTGFSATPADNRVFFDGHAATVLSATATSMVVRPDVASHDRLPVAVSVEVANQVSNALVFELVPSGTLDRLDVALPGSPSGVVEVGADIYFAAVGNNGNGNGGGLWKLSGGVVTRVLEPQVITVPNGTSGGTIDLVDGPLALATRGGDVYYTTLTGAVRRYAVASDTVTELVPPPPGSLFFPPRTGLAFDASGDLYVVDRNMTGGMIIRLRTNNTVTGISNAAFQLSPSGEPGIFGITSDGTDLFVTNEALGRVIRVTNLATTPTVNVVSNSTGRLQGITTVGAEVISSRGDGVLETIAKTASNGTPAVFGAAGGYMYQASAMTTTGAGILLAQPDGGAIRSKQTGMAASSIVAAGVRPALATLQLGSAWYAVTVGTELFRNGPQPQQPDTTIVEVTADGASRVLANTPLAVDLVASGTDLVASDCIEQRVFSLAIATAAQTDRLTSTDGVACALGLAIDSAGVLFYLDDPPGPGTLEIGKLDGTTHTASFATGIPAGSLSLALAGGNLVTASLDNQNPQPMHKVTAAAGGASSLLVPAFAAGGAALATAPDGTLFALRNSSSVAAIDPTAGSITPWITLVGTFAASMGFAPDGTAALFDLGHGGLVAIAP